MKQPEYSSLPHRRPQLDNHLREFLIREGLAIGASKAATAPEKGQPDNGSITKYVTTKVSACPSVSSGVFKLAFQPTALFPSLNLA